MADDISITTCTPVVLVKDESFLQFAHIYSWTLGSILSPLLALLYNRISDQLLSILQVCRRYTSAKHFICIFFYFLHPCIFPLFISWVTNKFLDIHSCIFWMSCKPATHFFCGCPSKASASHNYKQLQFYRRRMPLKKDVACQKMIEFFLHHSQCAIWHCCLVGSKSSACGDIHKKRTIAPATTAQARAVYTHTNG